MKKLLLILSVAFAINTQAQCCYTDTYSTSVGWTMNGSSYSIGPNTFSFSATPCNSSSSIPFSYATHPLPCTLSDTAWKGDIDFEYTGRGTSVGHTLLGVTAGALNAWNTASFGSTNQDAVVAYINGPNNGAQTTDSIFGAAKLGTTWNTSSKGIGLSMNVQYYIRLERISLTLGRISLFTDANRTIHATGSPQTFPINTTVTGLNVVQHGSIPQGYYTRTLTGTLDNLNICDHAIQQPVSPCCYTDSYSSSTGWIMNGLNYSIGPNTFSFSATPCDASSTNAFSYATRALPCTLSDTAWKGDIDFQYTGRGTGVGHTLLGVTAGALNAWNTASFGSTNQNAVVGFINSPSSGGQTTDSIFGAAKLGTTWSASSKGIALSMNVQYYIRLERVSATLGRISLFTDANRTIHATGVAISIENILGNLTPLYIPVSNFYIQPVVASINSRPLFIPSKDEVEELIEYKLKDILDESIVAETTVNLTAGLKIKAPYFNVQGNVLWGATAMLLSEIKQLLITNKTTFFFLFQ